MQVSTTVRVATAALFITLAGGILRFYGLGHGVPYHFHADEMLALRGSELLRAAPQVAAESAKFFIYPVVPKELLGLAANAYEALNHPLDLATKRDASVIMLLGRAVSAFTATLTIPIVFLVGRRVAGSVAGLVAGALMAGAVIAVANAHFFTSDSTLTLFCTLSMLASLYVAQTGRWFAHVCAGAGLGLALASKYTAGFLLLPLAIGHLISASRPLLGAGVRAWTRWTLLGLTPLLVAVLVFLAVNPLVPQHWDKFLNDVREGIVEPNFRTGGPIWTAQFADVPLRRVPGSRTCCRGISGPLWQDGRWRE